jgi:phage-related protein
MLASINGTLTEQYAQLADRALEASKQFDGSLESLSAVTEAFVAQRQAAIELVVALHNASSSIHQMLTDTKENIRQSLMQPDELYSYLKYKAESLADTISLTTDPNELAGIASSINEIIGTMYGSLDEDQRKAMASEFLSFLDGIDSAIQAQIREGINAVDESGTSINDQVTTAMMAAVGLNAETAAGYRTATDNFGNSVAQFVDAVNNFSRVASTTPVTPVTTATVRPTFESAAAYYRSLREVNA